MRVLNLEHARAHQSLSVSGLFLSFWEKAIERWSAQWLFDVSVSRVLSYVKFSISALAFPLLSQSLCRIARYSLDLPTVRDWEPG